MSAIYVVISGGLGKHVSFTGLLPALKEKYDDIYVNSAYPDVFIGNPFIKKVNIFANGQFYDNVMLNDDTRVVTIDPYDHEDFIKKKVHLLGAWAKLCGVSLANPMDVKTQLYINESEKFIIDRAKNEINKITKDKYILIQLNGGQTSINYQQNTNQEFDFSKEGTVRFYPFDYYVGLVKALKKKYPGHSIIRYGFSNEPLPSEIDNDIITLPYNIGTFKVYYELAKRAAAIVCIDSSLQHITAGVKRSVVIWGQTDPTHFGYNYHKNLRPETRSTYAYFRPFGDPYENTVFPNPDEVIEAIKDT